MALTVSTDSAVCRLEVTLSVPTVAVSRQVLQRLGMCGNARGHVGRHSRRISPSTTSRATTR
eukprot:1721371-Rhodomonas_salina.2